MLIRAPNSLRSIYLSIKINNYASFKLIRFLVRFDIDLSSCSLTGLPDGDSQGEDDTLCHPPSRVPSSSRPHSGTYTIYAAYCPSNKISSFPN